MTRLTAVLVALALFAASASAQPRPLPLAPGVMPGSPFGPGMPFAPVNPIPPGGLPPGARLAPNMVNPVLLGWGFGYQTYGLGGFGVGYPFGYYGSGYPFGGTVVDTTIIAPAAPVIAGPSGGIRVAEVPGNAFPATLTLQLPVSGEVWLNGKKLKDEGEEHVLTSPVLQPGEGYKFDVKAQWSRGGKTYETKREVILGSGERSRLMLVSGDEVKVDPPPAPSAPSAPSAPAPHAATRGHSGFKSLGNRLK